ncbi:MAG: pyruvate kinase [Gemmatimonadales bacterium]
MSYDPRFRRTKIVATLGPASADEATVSRMVEAGVTVMRINSSHGTPESRRELMQLVRRVRENMSRHIGILVDLQGPRIRVGVLAQPRQLAACSEVVFAPEAVALEDEIPTTYEALAADVTVGSAILLDDGLLAVEVTGVSGERVTGVVRQGGLLRSNKGMNLPGVHVSAPAVTEKDREDIALAVENGADFIGVSFVRRAEDLDQVKSLVDTSVRLVAKIEKAAALDDLDRIVDASDMIMVARGDLGVELPFERVPLTQKHLISTAIRRGRGVITATQMLESMVHNPRPTRAEASDVANAILDGTDAVMLSAETAVGAYPVQAVEAMVRIINEIERVLGAEGGFDRNTVPYDARSHREVEDAIAFATTGAAEMLEVPLIVCFTKSGFTARKIAANRPRTPILGLSTERKTCDSLSAVWGVIPQLAGSAPSYDAMLDVARETLIAREYVKPGDRIIVTAGVPFDVPGTTNLLKVEIV